jgi:predicted 2-oxoglutarate/Fe(II)-dependent dioxygenase YbiX
MIKMPEIGDPLPWISVPTTREARMPLNGLAGHSVILACTDPTIDHAALIEALEKSAQILAEHDAFWLAIVAPPGGGAPLPRLRNPRARLIPDTSGEVRRAFGFANSHNGTLCLLADSGLRVTARAHHRSADTPRETADWVNHVLTAGTRTQPDIDAPVMLIPDVIEARARDQLIAAWRDGGHKESGYLRPNEDGSVTHVVNPGRKRRSDHFLEDTDPLAALVHARVRARVAPWIERSTHFKIGFAERYRIACYDAETAGFFSPHRDFNEASTHRHFAMTIALNDDYEGGGLRFPEFGSREYVLRPGQAIVYSGSLLHEVTPVTAGRRFALVNFLTNGEGAQKVREYQHTHGDGLEHKTVG